MLEETQLKQGHKKFKINRKEKAHLQIFIKRKMYEYQSRPWLMSDNKCTRWKNFSKKHNMPKQPQEGK